MTYERADRPRTIFIGLLACAILAPFLYLSVQPNHASAFTRDLNLCAKEAGIGEPEWEPMHGFHDFNIGREFHAKSTAEKEALSCVLATSEAEWKTRAPDVGDEHPTVRIWHGESFFDADTVVYHPASL